MDSSQRPLGGDFPAPLPGGGGSGTPPRSGTPSRFTTWVRAGARAGVLVVGFLAALYLIEGVDSLTDQNRLDQEGISPRSVDGLSGIVFAPVLHAGWGHLLSNTLPILVLGWLVLVTGIWRGLSATAVIWVVAGVGTWLTGAPGTLHLGASSLVFGWLTYLMVRGWFARSPGQIALGVVVFVCYGSALWGVLPNQPGISWQGHLFGALGGVVAGWLLCRDQAESRVPAD